MGFWENIRYGGFGDSGGLKGILEEVVDHIKPVGESCIDLTERVAEKTNMPITMSISLLLTNPSMLKGALALEEVHNAAQRARKDITEKADDLHPLLGKTVENIYNLSDTIENNTESIKNGIQRSLFAKNVNVDNLEIADHLYVQGVGYTHHGLYVGDGEVMHYRLDGDEVSIHVDDLSEFSGGKKIFKKSDRVSIINYPRNQVVARAYQRQGEENYNLLLNNCENFVRWCRSGADR